MTSADDAIYKGCEFTDALKRNVSGFFHVLDVYFSHTYS